MSTPSKGLADVVAASTALSDIDGIRGLLSYRGYDIHDLAGRIGFEECVHLLHHGSLPDRAGLTALTERLAEGRRLGGLVADVLDAVARSQAPMEALRTLVSLSSADDPDAASNEPAADLRKAARLTGRQPGLVARYHAARRGVTVPDPDPTLGIAGDFLLQITGRRPSAREVEIFDECLVLHADHTMNASTFAARVCAATLSDMHSAIVAAIGTLKGPLHGGANEQVMHMLETIGSAAEAPRAVRARLDAGQKIPGFGHRVYKTEDPRATHLRRLARELAGSTGDDRWWAISRRIEEAVLAEKRLFPNVDFFAASVYRGLGIPTDLFTPVFSISRMAGWTAHVIEQHADNRLIRPGSEYVGEHDREWVPLDRR
ncbi:citrate synthase [Actinoallomurus purpureus]|uniref:citrate/2-methylcitrate synthase n=1 Tax=Actinoallomurus purpureus TaxID=478114 RepID=UPI00209383A0|nr:citrate/2-methylcitrate synthase [Actinoallomurus purpureus]MCO6004706.1 citrate synthase [Actinoallomurus purpureus]